MIIPFDDHIESPSATPAPFNETKAVASSSPMPVLVDGVTIIGDGITTPLQAVPVVAPPSGSGMFIPAPIIRGAGYSTISKYVLFFATYEDDPTDREWMSHNPHYVLLRHHPNRRSIRYDSGSPVIVRKPAGWYHVAHSRYGLYPGMGKLSGVDSATTPSRETAWPVLYNAGDSLRPQTEISPRPHHYWRKRGGNIGVGEDWLAEFGGQVPTATWRQDFHMTGKGRLGVTNKTIIPFKLQIVCGNPLWDGVDKDARMLFGPVSAETMIVQVAGNASFVYGWKWNTK